MIPASTLWKARAAAGAGGSTPYIIAYQISGYSRTFCTAPTGFTDWYSWISLGFAGQFTMTAQDLEGGCSTSDVSFTVTDYNRQLTADLQTGINLLGKTCTILVGFPGMAQADYITLMTLLVDHIDLANNNTAYKFTLHDNSLLMQQFAFQTSNNGYPTSKQNPVTVQGSPMAILETAVEDSGLPSANLNTTAIDNLNTNVYFGLNFQFNLTYPPRAKDFMEQELLKPLGAYWYWNYLGQLTPYSMLPYEEPASEMTLDGSNIDLATPPVPLRAKEYKSVVIYKMDADSNGQNFQTVIVGEYAPAVNLYGITQSSQIISRGVQSSLGGARIAHLTMQNIFRRYGLKPFTLRIRCFLPAFLLELSDHVTVTHPKIPNGMWPSKFRMPGTMGITGTMWEVIGKTVDFNDGTVELTLLDTSWLVEYGLWLFAPNTEPTYTSAINSKYMFVCGSGNKYSNGDTARLLY